MDSLPARILQVHNYYQQAGGEDQVLAAEARLLARRGHHVEQFTASNDHVEDYSRLALAAKTIWNRAAARELRETLRRERPQVVHVHNTLPLFSPAVYYAAHAEGVPVVQTLHNYRLICPSGLLLRDGAVCEECVGKKVPAPAVVHGCYRGSRAASGAVAGMLTVHNGMRTWERKVDAYIALTEFARAKFVAGGLPRERLAVKPNFLDLDPGTRTGDGDYALFVGRISPEKGVDVLLAAWEQLSERVPLKIVGGGPLEEQLAIRARAIPGVEWLGSQSRDEVIPLLKAARMLILPSLCYEGLPTTIVEAFACGVPVVASDMGSMSSLVTPGCTGLHFLPGDAADLASKAEWAWRHPREMAQMGRQARLEFEGKYTAEANYHLLMQIYTSAINHRRGARD